MLKVSAFQIILILTLSITVISFSHVFAISMPDSPWQTLAKNYAKITVVTNCDAGNGGDSDNDGICNNWESTTNPGLHINFLDSGANPATYTYNLSCTPGATIATDPTGVTVCPDPHRKDIYVELDSMTGQAPSMTAIADVVKAFDKMGITLHVIGGENATTNSGNMGLHYCFIHPIKATNTLSPITTNDCSFSGTTIPAQSLALLKKNFFGTVAERAGDANFCPNSQLPSDATSAGPVANANSYNCLTAKRQVFHYMVVANSLAVNTGTGVDTTQSGWAEVPGNDAVISLGSFTNGVGNIDEQEGTIMHELGHNLGLHHGGGANPPGTTEDDNNCKPNYQSVMSYTYQFRKTFDECRPLAFSNGVLGPFSNGIVGPVSESAISDSNIDTGGIAIYPADNPNPPDNTTKSPACPQNGERKFVWSSTSGVQTSTNSIIDWNMNGRIDATPVSQNVNKLSITGCNTATISNLSGFNDTAFLYSTGTLPLVFRTTALANFQAAIPAGTDGDPDIGQGEFTENEQSSNPVVNQIIPLTITCQDGAVIPATAQCPVPQDPGMLWAMVVAVATIGVIIAISIIVARRR